MARREEKLTKAEIIDNIYSQEHNKLRRQDIYQVVDAFLKEVHSALTDDRVIELRGFGTFEIRTRKGRKKAHNPKTGEPVSIEKHGVAFFRPGEKLKNLSWSLRN